MINFQDAAIFGFVTQKIAVGTDGDGGVGHRFFTQSVNGRVGHLGKELFEIMKQRRMFVRQHRQGYIMPHGHDGLASCFRHRQNLFKHILIGIAKGAIKLVALRLGMNGDFLIGNMKIPEADEITIKPFAVGLMSGVCCFAGFVGNDPPRFGVDNEHFAGFQA